MSVEIRIKAVNKFKKGIDGAIAGVKKLGSMVKSVSMAMFRMTKWAVIGLTGIGLWSIKTASAMREMGDKFGRVFKEQSQAAEDFAATLAKHIGRSIFMMNENLTVFQSLFVGVGIGGGEAVKMS